MRKIIICILTILMITSCRMKISQEYYDNGLVDFAMDIAQNPDKLYDLENLYPQFYNKDYLFITMKDSADLSNNIDRIKNEFCKFEERINPNHISIHQADIMSMNLVAGTNFHFRDEQLYGLSLDKEDNNRCLLFIFIKSDSGKFNIFRIKTENIRVSR